MEPAILKINKEINIMTYWNYLKGNFYYYKGLTFPQTNILPHFPIENKHTCYKYTLSRSKNVINCTAIVQRTAMNTQE